MKLCEITLGPAGSYPFWQIRLSNHSFSDRTGSYLDVKCKVGAEMEVAKLADDVGVGVHR
jgi:hypothetical protein